MHNPLHEIYIPEAEENLIILEDRIIGMEENPQDKEIINEAFRAIHSIKGGAGLAGFIKIKDFTHIVEDLFEDLRNGSLIADEEMISVLLKTMDVLKVMVENIKNEREADEELDYSDITDKINAYIQQSSNAQEVQREELESKEQGGKYYFLNLHYYPHIFKTGLDPMMFFSDLRAIGDLLYVSLDCSDLPEMEKFDPTSLYLKWKCFLQTSISQQELEDIFCFVIDESEISIVELTDKLDDQESMVNYSIDGKAIVSFIGGMEETEEVEEAPGEIKLRRSTDMATSSYIRVQTEKLERIFNTVSELIISEAHLNLLTEQYEEEIPEDFTSVSDTLKEITRVLQEQVTSLRMMSLNSTFDRFKRVVRDIAVDLDKKVQLEIRGQDTELDKNMIEKLNDPLKHIVRNSIDHGIETESERIALGKSPQGKLELSAYIEDGKVTIEIKDDGRGIDRERLLDKAEAAGIIKDREALSESEILNLIFHPGLSTAKEVTDLSGRGVGMDVVKSSIMDLNGNIHVQSTPGLGTIIKLHLPLTLAILDGMLVDIGEDKFVIPTLSILEIFRPEKGDLKSISGKGEVVMFRGDYIPMIRLHSIFDAVNAQEAPEKAELIVVTSLGIRAALLVDNVLEQFQVVLKSLQKNFRKITNISSATILGNGDVALILDIQNILQNFAMVQNV